MSRISAVISIFCLISSSSFAAILYTKDYTSAQAAISAVKPGDALVFDASRGTEAISVVTPIRDVQFIGGSGNWTIKSDLIDCAFYWHSPKLNQTAGQIRRTVFFQSTTSSGMFFTHVDSVSFFFQGNYLWPHNNPDKGLTPQMQFNGFVRGLLIHKPIVGIMSQTGRHFSYHLAPALRINATDPVGNGWGTYILGAIIWENTSWTPFHIVRGSGITFAHVNTEYGRWADPIADFDQTNDCVLLCNGVGGRSDAVSAEYNKIDTIHYWNGIEYGCPFNIVAAPWRGPAFRLGGQRNRSVATGGYRSWASGLKDYLPAQHVADGITARDPFYTEWCNAIGTMNLNFSQRKSVFILKNNGSNSTWGSPLKYPVNGSDLIRPVVMPLADLRAVHMKDKVDMTGKSVQEITATLATKDVYLGPGNYNFGAALTTGKVIWGAGIGKTIITFDASSEGNTSGGFANCTVRGGKVGIISTGGWFQKNLFRVRFENMTKAALLNAAGGCYQNDSFIGLEFVNCAKAFAEEGGSCGEPFKTDKVDVINCLFKNIDSTAIVMSAGNNKNGHVAITACTFDSIGDAAIDIRQGGTHLALNITVRNSYLSKSKSAVSLASAGWGQACAAAYVDIDNSKITLPGTEKVALTLGGVGAVSHCTVKGFAGKTGVDASKSVVDHVTSDGSLSGGFYLARSQFSDVNAGISDTKIAFRSATSGTWTKSDGHDQQLDNTAPSPVSNIQVSLKQNDPKYPYLSRFNLITWNPARDAESGIISYIVYSKGVEIGRTRGVTVNGRTNGTVEFDTVATVCYYRDSVTTRSDYTVLPINGAGMLSDGTIASVRRWTPERGYFMTTDTTEFRCHKIDRTAESVTDTIRKITIAGYYTRDAQKKPDLWTDLPGAIPPASHPPRITCEFGELSLTNSDFPSAAKPKPRHTFGATAPSFTGQGVIFVPTAAKVRIDVYSIMGRKIKTLAHKQFTSGTHSFIQDMESFPGGMYILHMVSDGAEAASTVGVYK